MGAVYRARDPRLDRFVALKIIHPSLGGTPSGSSEVLVRRFQREARLQAVLEHPHICRVYEIGELPSEPGEPGYPYIAMQLIVGRPLHRAQGGMSLFDKVRVMQQVAEALHAAHRQGLVHRDIKPSNIMIEQIGEGGLHPYVMDFGIAREVAGADHSRSGAIEGTPRYMSPEQARGDTQHLDRRTDVHALGVTLYELLTGRSPFAGMTDVEVLFAVLTAEPAPLRTLDKDIPVDLEAVVLKCLEKEPAARYDSAKALADDLGRYLDGEPVLARRIGTGQRLVRRARKHKALFALGAGLIVSLFGLVAYGIQTRIASAARERTAQQQALLSQRLGQEIKDMEWLLRSARQLPLHDLRREKAMVRDRMARLRAELSRYGQRGAALGHYALGRGHMNLHEYPQALTHLQQAMALGYDDPEVHYALGIVLGKHYEQAMYEARLSGGGEWASKRLKEIEPKYLTPAIASLQRSRQAIGSSAQYLEGLISFYKRDYTNALRNSESALAEAPWIYESAKLGGDVHLELALKAKDAGRYEEAEMEFALAIHGYTQAATIGASDSEVYEGMSEAWVRQVEMAARRGQPIEQHYRHATEATDKLVVADPDGVAGPLKKAFAAMLTMAINGAGSVSEERERACLAAANVVLQRQPSNPYASEAAASCHGVAASLAQSKGEDPTPLLRQAINFLKPSVEANPQFLWGIHDLSTWHAILSLALNQRGKPEADDYLNEAIKYEQRALSLDPNFEAGWFALLDYYAHSVNIRQKGGLTDIAKLADYAFEKCGSINHLSPFCQYNYATVYAYIGRRLFGQGLDPRPWLTKAFAHFKHCQQLGCNFLDAEQRLSLALLIEAMDRTRRREDPQPVLKELSATLGRCLSMAAQDATCHGLAAQAEWVRAEWLAAQGRPMLPALQKALANAQQATASPENLPDAWYAMAETFLRLAQSFPGAQRARHVQPGLVAAQRALSVNPRHADALLTRGALLLLQAEQESSVVLRREQARAALASLEEAAQIDKSLAPRSALLRAQSAAWTKP